MDRVLLHIFRTPGRVAPELYHYFLDPVVSYGLFLEIYGEIVVVVIVGFASWCPLSSRPHRLLPLVCFGKLSSLCTGLLTMARLASERSAGPTTHSPSSSPAPATPAAAARPRAASRTRTDKKALLDALADELKRARAQAEDEARRMIEVEEQVRPHPQPCLSLSCADKAMPDCTGRSS